MLDPKIEKRTDNNWWLTWTKDPEAIAYDIITSEGKHVQAGKTKTDAKLGTTKPDPLPQISAAHTGIYETAKDPTAPPPPPPPPPPTGDPVTWTSTISDGQTLTQPTEWSIVPSEGISGVDYYIDGTKKWHEAISPYVFNGDPGGMLDPSLFSAGTHKLKVVVTALDGEVAEKEISVTFEAAPLPPPSNTSRGRIGPYYKTVSGDETWLDIDANESYIDQKCAAVFVYGGFALRWPQLKDKGISYLDIATMYNPSSIATQHPEWILRDKKDGQMLYLPYALPKQYAADIGHPGFQQWIAQQAKSAVDSGWRGIFCDDFNQGGFYSCTSGGTSVVPYDPRTNATMTLANYRKYFADLAAAMRAAIPNAYIVQNRVFYTTPVSDPEIQRAMKAASCVCYERGFTDGGLTGGTGKWSMYQYMKHVDDVHKLGVDAYHLSYSGDAIGAELNLACALLVSGGEDLAGSSYGMYPPGVKSGWFPPYDWDLGDSTGDRYQWNGVWRRDFKGGMVLMNEPGASTKTLSLGKNYLNSAGQSVSSVSLSGRQGKVLKSV